MTTQTSLFDSENTLSTSNNLANAPSPGAGPRPAAPSPANTSIGHATDTVTKQGSPATKTKRNLDTGTKIPRSHALQKGVNSNPVGFYSEMCHSQIQSQSRPLKSGGKSSVRGKSSAYDIVAELARRASHCHHLDAPKPAVAHFGPEPEDLMDWYVDLQRKAKVEFEERELEDGRRFRAKQRSSTAIVMVALASYPGAPDHSDERYLEWIELNVEQAKRSYGKKLIGIYEHVDEPHGHLHILVADEGKPIKPTMAGDGAFQRELDAGGTRREAGAAKNAANSKLLDDYFEHVNKPLGIARKNAVPRARMSWKAAKTGQLKDVENFQEQERARLKEAEDAQEAERVKLKESRTKITSRILELEEESVRIFKEKHKIIDAKSAMERAMERALKTREEKLAAREAKIIKAEALSAAREAKFKGLQNAFDAIELYVPLALREEARKAAKDAFKAAMTTAKTIKPE